MNRLLLVFVVAASAIAAPGAVAYQYPMVPYDAASGPMLNGGINGPMMPNSPGTPAPPTCSDSLDFSDGCNSQYLSIMRF